MSYITREDGEHFVIPSYRDVLTAKQKNQLKKEILMLSQSYGEYITLQKKNADQYEVAFSPDTGYLLGESLWHNFKKPLDMIYCEAIPNSTEAILVIVKSGSVYLDGSFPLDSIPEELIIFLTQQNNFEIYTHGDVPISREPEAGKFSFEESSVKSFNVLDKPVFPTLPLMKMYQLQLVDPVLKAQGIGTFPTQKIVIGVVALGVAWALWSFIFSAKQEYVETKKQPEVNPYQQFYNILSSPAPDQEIDQFLAVYNQLMLMPGWKAKELKYIHKNLYATVLSGGGKIDELFNWTNNNRMTVTIDKSGITVNKSFNIKNRPLPQNIYKMNDVIATLVDRLSTVFPGNNLMLSEFGRKGVFTQVTIQLRFTKVTPLVLSLIAKELEGLPVVLHDITVTSDATFNLNGSLTIQALGN